MNPTINSYNFIAITPEIWLVLTIVMLTILSLLNKTSKSSGWAVASLCLLCNITYIINSQHKLLNDNLFEGDIAIDPIGLWLKVGLLTISILILIFYGGVEKITNWQHGLQEYVIIILFATLGGMIAISARNFLVLYVALEVVSLSGYILAAFDRDKLFSTEAGIKYFILGSLASCIMIFGLSYIYGFSNSLDFYVINSLLDDGSKNSGLIIGLGIFTIALLFKLSIAPFHVWTPDVYQGAPLVTGAFFATVPKFIITVVMINIINLIIIDIKEYWVQGFLILSVLSITVGCFGAITQTSFKRLMGYSTILNLGFVLLAVSTVTSKGFASAIIYQIIYSVASIGIFAVMAITQSNAAEDYLIDQLAGFGSSKKNLALSLSILMFSVMGLPPLAGFFAKFNVISSVVSEGYYVSAVIALILSVVAAFYYLSVVKVLYFITPTRDNVSMNESFTLQLLITTCTFLTITIPVLQYWLS